MQRLYALVLTAALIPVLTVAAAAQDEADIRAAMALWSETYSTAVSADEMLALYHPDAAFWGTGATTPMVGAVAFGPYFQNQFDNFTDRSHTFLETVIQFPAEGVATATGLYRFNVTPVGGGAAIEVTYRHSFAYVLDGDIWLIIQQHSSQIPR